LWHFPKKTLLVARNGDLFEEFVAFHKSQINLY
jgi:hypothetical protein